MDIFGFAALDVTPDTPNIEPVKVPTSIEYTTDEPASTFHIAVEKKKTPQRQAEEKPASEPKHLEQTTTQETKQNTSHDQAPQKRADKPVEEKQDTTVYAKSGMNVLGTAYKYVGSPYVHGGASPSGWDCIGYVSYVYGRHGVSIGRSYGAMLSAGRQVTYSQAQAGDILVWPGRHVAISLGNGQNIGAWSTSLGTKTGPDAWVGGIPTVIRVS